MKCQSLFQLILDENEIKQADLFNMKKLRVVSMNKNKLTNLRGFALLEALEELSLAENEINNVEGGLAGANCLLKLNLAQNKLESL
jgi:Leucine-rich repeat (LRR) protein